MNVLMAFVIGALFAGGLYMMLRRSLVRIIIGLLLLSNAINLMIFTAGRLVPGQPPLIPLQADEIMPPFADPLPQALVLTAIVISFGVTAFAVILIRQTYTMVGSDDLNEMRYTDLPVPVDRENSNNDQESEVMEPVEPVREGTR
jgi:multicomponent Na+:H+ antiporter subunit C